MTLQPEVNSTAEHYDAPTAVQSSSLLQGHQTLLRTMDRAGWTLDWVDIDLTGRAPKLELRATRHDGLWVRGVVDQLGRGSLERFHRERTLGMSPNQKGRRPMVPLVDDRFMGRTRYEGARALMQGVCGYLVDNALNPVELQDMQSAWARLMQEPARFGQHKLEAS